MFGLGGVAAQAEQQTKTYIYKELCEGTTKACYVQVVGVLCKEEFVWIANFSLSYSRLCLF